MNSLEALELEDLALDESPDSIMAMMLPDPRSYLAEDARSDEQGFRSLFEYPEALSKSFRCQLH
jgi:hypothetical protein